MLTFLLAKENYNSSINYSRQKPSVIFCVQFSTFLYKCAIFDQFVNKHVRFEMDEKGFRLCAFRFMNPLLILK